MELIINNGVPQDALEKFPDIQRWVAEWLSNQSMFEFETSGTTGFPKRLTFSRNQLMSSAIRTCEYFQLEQSTKVLHRLPMNFVAGRMNIIRALVMKHSVWAENPSMRFGHDWNPKQLTFDWWPTTPAMLSVFLELNLNPNVFKKILLGGGPVQDKLIADLKCFNGKCFESYGSTETLTHIAIRSISPAIKPFTCLPGVTIAQVNEGIYIEDELTQIKTTLSDHLLINENGEFQLLGRFDDVINSGGVKVHPVLVENLLSKHSANPFFISKYKDPTWGEAIALIVLNEDLMEWKKLDLKKVFFEHPLWRPKWMIAVNTIEQNENGKIVRKYNFNGLVDRV